MNPPRPSLKARLLSASYYLGLAPITRWWGSRSGSTVVAFHYKQAQAALFFALALFLTACAFEAFECFLHIRFPALERQRLVASIWSALDYTELLVLAAFVPLWITLLVLAVVGSTWPVPLLRRLVQARWPMRVSPLVNICLLLLFPILGGFAYWSSSLVSRCTPEAKVYFLYDEGIVVPRWGYAMGLSRIALQANERWGKGAAVLDRLTRETVRTALAKGRVVILATHGADGCAVTYYAPEVLGIWPADLGETDESNRRTFLRTGIRHSDDKWVQVENISVNNHLQLAYVFACNGGKRARQWREHLAPAQVVTYDRASTVWDHARWFAFTGPAELKKLK